MPQLCLILFCGFFAVVVYTLAGYPLLLGWIARRHYHPVRKDTELRSVSFIIPVHNGEKFIENKLRSIQALNYPPELIEILVLSDASTDRTDEIASRFAPAGVRVVRLPRGGKPAAINAGVPLSTGEILIFNDVRQTLHPDSLRNLVACFGDPTVAAVSAQLSIRAGETSAEHDTGLYWRYELWIRQQMTRIHSTWGTTGCYYGMRRSLFKPIPPDTLIDDAWLPLTAVFQGYRCILEPTAVMYDFPTALDSEFRRKVRTQAGLYQLIGLLPGLFSSRNPMRFHFLCGKYSRLIIPWCLIGMAIATFGLPELLRTIALAGQILFYLAAIVDPAVPAGFPLKKLTSPIRTFVTLMAAALFAIRIFFVPPRSLWKETTVRDTVQAPAD
jgi:cellulose synthase/poly-beta-1,6-N-acetylglucosamine synthase-like glycosyltransferase